MSNKVWVVGVEPGLRIGVFALHGGVVRWEEASREKDGKAWADMQKGYLNLAFLPLGTALPIAACYAEYDEEAHTHVLYHVDCWPDAVRCYFGLPS